jgi:hypothetical protein
VNAALVEFLADAKAAPAREGGIVERIKGWLGLSVGRSVSRSTG